MLGALVAVVLGWSFVSAPALAAALVTGTLSVLALLLLVRTSRKWLDDDATARRLLVWTLTAFALHAVIGIAILGSSGATSFFGPDARGYHEAARQIVSSWTEHSPFPQVAGGKEGFYYLLAILYYIFGPHPIAGVIVNAGLTAATIPLMTVATKRLVGAEPARFVPPLLLLLPGFLVWPSQLLREAGILFLISVAVFSTVQLLDETRPTGIIALGTSLAVLLTFRSNVALVLTFGLMLGLMVGKRHLVTSVGVGFSTLSFLLLLVFSLGIGYSGYRYASSVDLETANSARADLSTANSGFGASTNISTPSRAVQSLPTSLAQFLLGPFPWQARSFRQLTGVVEAATLWVLVPSFLRGVRGFRHMAPRRVYVLLLPAFMVAAMLSLVIGNFGAVVRERTQIVILLVPLIAIGLAQRRAQNAPVDEFSSLGLAPLGGLDRGPG